MRDLGNRLFLLSVSTTLLLGSLPAEAGMFVRHRHRLDIYDLCFILALAAVLVLARFLPRLSAYVFGPGLLLLAAGFFTSAQPLFFGFRSEGSAAGLIVPVLMWLVLGVMVLFGVMLTAGGRKRIREEEHQEVEEGVDASSRFSRRLERGLVVVALLVGAALYLGQQPFGPALPAALKQAVRCSAGLDEHAFQELRSFQFAMPCLAAEPPAAPAEGESPRSSDDAPQLRYARQAAGGFLAIAPGSPDETAEYLIDIDMVPHAVLGGGRRGNEFRVVGSHDSGGDMVRLPMPEQLSYLARQFKATFHCEGPGLRSEQWADPQRPRALVCRAAIGDRDESGVLVTVRIRAGANLTRDDLEGRVLPEVLALLDLHAVPSPKGTLAVR